MEERSNSGPILSSDILIEILCRLPVNTLVQLCCVCKFWKNLILSDNVFIKFHLKQSMKNTGRSCGNVLMYSVWPWDCDTHTSDLPVQRFIEADENILSKSFFLGTRFSLIGCINGVFCLYESWNYHIYLWNPALHQCHILPRRRHCPAWLDVEGLQFDVVGFLYEPTDDDYMVVVIDGELLHIYELSKNAWRKIEFPNQTSGKGHFITDRVAIVRDRALHWLSFSNNSEEGEKFFLNVYNLSSKKIQETLLSDRIPLQSFHVKLGLIKGCLCLLGTSETNSSKYEVWMMEKCDEDNLWTKKFEFPTHIYPGRYMSGFRTSGKFVVELILEGRLALYDPGSGEIEYVQYREILLSDYCKWAPCFFADNYVESLVSVLPPVKRASAGTNK